MRLLTCVACAAQRARGVRVLVQLEAQFMTRHSLPCGPLEALIAASQRVQQMEPGAPASQDEDVGASPPVHPTPQRGLERCEEVPCAVQGGSVGPGVIAHADDVAMAASRVAADVAAAPAPTVAAAPGTSPWQGSSPLTQHTARALIRVGATYLSHQRGNSDADDAALPEPAFDGCTPPNPHRATPVRKSLLFEHPPGVAHVDVAVSHGGCPRAADDSDDDDEFTQSAVRILDKVEGALCRNPDIGAVLGGGDECGRAIADAVAASGSPPPSTLPAPTGAVGAVPLVDGLPRPTAVFEQPAAPASPAVASGFVPAACALHAGGSVLAPAAAVVAEPQSYATPTLPRAASVRIPMASPSTAVEDEAFAVMMDSFEAELLRLQTRSASCGPQAAPRGVVVAPPAPSGPRVATVAAVPPGHPAVQPTGASVVVAGAAMLPTSGGGSDMAPPVARGFVTASNKELGPPSRLSLKRAREMMKDADAAAATGVVRDADSTSLPKQQRTGDIAAGDDAAGGATARDTVAGDVGPGATVAARAMPCLATDDDISDELLLLAALREESGDTSGRPAAHATTSSGVRQALPVDFASVWCRLWTRGSADASSDRRYVRCLVVGDSGPVEGAGGPERRLAVWQRASLAHSDGRACCACGKGISVTSSLELQASLSQYLSGGGGQDAPTSAPVAGSPTCRCPYPASVLHVVLRAEWAFAAAQVGDVVHVVHCNESGVPASWTSQDRALASTVVVDSEQNALIVCPDNLVSPSRITGSINCLRRTVLSDLVTASSTSSSDTGKNALLGTVRTSLAGMHTHSYHTGGGASCMRAAQALLVRVCSGPAMRGCRRAA